VYTTGRETREDDQCRWELKLAERLKHLALEAVAHRGESNDLFRYDDRIAADPFRDDEEEVWG